MSALLLDGKKLASTSEIEIAKEVSELKSYGINPTLATILVGNDPASETYVRMKRNTCKRVGMESIAVEHQIAFVSEPARFIAARWLQKLKTSIFTD